MATVRCPYCNAQLEREAHHPHCLRAALDGHPTDRILTPLERLQYAPPPAGTPRRD